MRPEVAAGVSDHGFKFLTGNWTFNTAFAGTLPGMRAYVIFSDISELEDWIAAGIPVHHLGARYDLLRDGRTDDFNGPSPSAVASQKMATSSSTILDRGRES